MRSGLVQTGLERALRNLLPPAEPLAVWAQKTLSAQSQDPESDFHGRRNEEGGGTASLKYGKRQAAWRRALPEVSGPRGQLQMERGSDLQP